MAKIFNGADIGTVLDKVFRTLFFFIFYRSPIVRGMVMGQNKLAAIYLLMSTMLVFIPVVKSATTPSPEQLQLVYMLHNVFKADPALKNSLSYLLHAEAGIPENVSLPAGATMNPLMTLFLAGLKNLRPDQAMTGVTHSAVNSTAPPSGNIIASLSQDPLLKDLINIVMKQIIEGQQKAAASNQTLGTDLSSLLGLVKPVTVVQSLLASRPARSMIPNLPQGHVSDACYRDVMDTIDALIVTKMWAVQMLDAMGKPGAGVERGYFYFVGSYDQCYLIKPHIAKNDVIGGVTQTESREFGTHFCRADITIPDSFIDSLHVNTHGVHLKLTLGLCMPDSCHTSDIHGLFQLGVVQKFVQPSIEGAYCYEEKDISSDKSAVAAICVLSVFATLIHFGTLLDIYVQNRKANSAEKGGKQSSSSDQPVAEISHTSINLTLALETNKDNVIPVGYMPHKEGDCPLPSFTNGNAHALNGFGHHKQEEVASDGEKKSSNATRDSLAVRFFVCFSLYTNIPKILQAKSTSGSVTCIHGIRFLSLTWVVLGHTYNYGIISQDETFTADNLLDFVPIMQRFSYQAVIGGGFAVDTFFVLSAFLLTWLQLKDTKKKTKKCTLFDGIMYYFHRFWRLTPIYMIVLMTFGCLYQYMGSGPFWPSKIWGAEHCKSVWWTNLLYVNNLVSTKAQCMGWTWYLANDMQFYVISPLFLFFMYIKPVFGAILTCALLAMGIGIAFWREYEINGNFFTMKSDGGAFWEEVYTVPWCRVGCWAVGMLLGLLVYKRGRKPLQSQFMCFLCWVVAAAVALTLVYTPYSENKEDGKEWTNTQRAFYEAFGRPAWGLVVAWVIFACYSHMGGIVNSFLSWNGFIPLSRLTYAAYLVHPICMMIYVFSKRTLLHVNDYNIVYLYLGHLCVTYMVAFVCSLAFEAPTMALEKILFHRGRRN